MQHSTGCACFGVPTFELWAAPMWVNAPGYTEGMLHYKKVLLLLDLSAESERVLAVGKEIAEHSSATLVALHVVEFVPVEPMGETLLATPQIEEDLIKRADAKLRDALAKSGLSQMRCRVEAGNTKAEILRVAAEENADLIVLGSRERHGLAILVNFTEDTILHAARCDVLAVRLK
jgi:universal stress protein A